VELRKRTTKSKYIQMTKKRVFFKL
jgi:hypothetical protein